MGGNLITIRHYNPDIDRGLAEIHGTKSAGAVRAVEAYLAIRAHTLHEIKGMFTKNELSFLVDIQNGSMFEHKFAASASAWIARIEDTDKLFPFTVKQWEVDVKEIIEKIKTMPSAQIYFTQELIDLFWSDDKRDLDGFIEQLTKNG